MDAKLKNPLLKIGLVHNTFARYFSMVPHSQPDIDLGADHIHPNILV